MGAVVSCFQAIGACIMSVINAIAGVIMAIINGIVSVLAAIVNFLTCGFCGGKGGRRRKHGGATSRV